MFIFALFNIDIIIFSFIRHNKMTDNEKIKLQTNKQTNNKQRTLITLKLN